MAAAGSGISVKDEDQVAVYGEGVSKEAILEGAATTIHHATIRVSGGVPPVWVHGAPCVARRAPWPVLHRSASNAYGGEQ